MRFKKYNNYPGVSIEKAFKKIAEDFPKVIEEKTEDPKFIILMGPEGNRFYTSYDKNYHYHSYSVIGYANTSEEAQNKMYKTNFDRIVMHIRNGGPMNSIE